jgi:transposase-like protein
MTWSQERIDEVLEAVEKGKSVAQAAKEYKIPRSTLRGWISGSIPRREQVSHQKLLSDYQEDRLAHWVEVQHLLGMPPSHNAIRLAATAFLEAANSTDRLGPRWSITFLARHPHLKTLQGKGHDL